MPKNESFGLEQYIATIQLADRTEAEKTKGIYPVVWYSGERILRYDWDKGGEFDMSISMEPKAGDFGRLNKSGSVLDGHSYGRVQDGNVLGRIVPGSVKTDGKENRASIRMSKRESLSEVREDMDDGIITNVSIGFEIKAMVDRSERDDQGEVLGRQHWEVTEYEPHELSIVPVGAVGTARIESGLMQWAVQHGVGNPPGPGKEDEMSQKKEGSDAAAKTQEEQIAELQAQVGDDYKVLSVGGKITLLKVAEPEIETPETDDVTLSASDVLKAERERVSEIRRSGALGKFSPEQIDKFVAMNLDAGATVVKMFNELAAESDADEQGGLAPPSRVRVGRDATVTEREGMVDSLCHQMSLGRSELPDSARKWAGWRMTDMLRVFGERSGIEVNGWGANHMGEFATHISEDFPHILSNVASKMLHRAYNEYDRTFLRWTNQSTNSDFKTKVVPQLAEHPALRKVAEGAEIQRVTIGEGKEEYALATYAEIFGLSRQAIIGDDLEAFARMTRLQGNAAARTESNLAYGQLITNATYGQGADGPAMFDGVDLFDSARNNDLGTPAAFTVAAVGAARQLMREQKGLDGVTSIQLTPAILLVGPDNETVAQQFVASTTPSQMSEVNPFYNSLQVVPEVRLADDTSPKRWYLIASPSEAETMATATLQGNNGPYMEQRRGFEVDELQWKVRTDFVAHWLDFRSIVRSEST